MPVFRVTRAEVGFGSSPAVLRDLDWQLSEKDLCAVVGPGGGGKSTFLKSLMGLIPLKRGTIEFRGQPVSSISRSQFLRDVTMTFQKSGLFDSMTCAENLFFPLRELMKVTGKAAQIEVARALEEVGLGDKSDLSVNEMSGGMQKRLGIARALILRPAVVLYDDPTAGLDPITARSILALIESVHQKYAMTCVVVTSELSQARRICPTVAYLDGGKIAAMGTWEKVERQENAAPFFAAVHAPANKGGVT